MNWFHEILYCGVLINFANKLKFCLNQTRIMESFCEDLHVFLRAKVTVCRISSRTGYHATTWEVPSSDVTDAIRKSQKSTPGGSVGIDIMLAFPDFLKLLPGFWHSTFCRMEREDVTYFTPLLCGKPSHPREASCICMSLKPRLQLQSPCHYYCSCSHHVTITAVTSTRLYTNITHWIIMIRQM
jgi:hypothetical protein